MFEEIAKRLLALEGYASGVEGRIKDLIKEALGKLKVTPPDTLNSLQIGLCVTTVDPHKQNRIRFYHPTLSGPNVTVDQLPFAYPISAGFPSFDDSGITWVPPAGTLVTLLFLYGHRNMAFYFGSIWNRERNTSPPNLTPPGSQSGTGFAYPIKEFDDYWKDTPSGRGGYLIGPKKGKDSQVFPPFNTWNYNGYDYDEDSQTSNQQDKDTETIPTIYGIKTPEKAGIIWNDGDRKCNLRWKHTLIFSSRGNFILMKDDHLHPAGAWANPQCPNASGGGDATDCKGESPSCCNCGSENCPGGPMCPGDPANGSRFANKYFKREDECRPYTGPDSSTIPLAGLENGAKALLPQTGIHIQSLSGHHIFFDDSVNMPTDIPAWDKAFSDGCDPAKLYCKIRLMSSTGHSIVLNDNEDEPKNRGKDNYVRIQSATGNTIELNDHTINKKTAGGKRGIWMESTCKHRLEMCDKDNEMASQERLPGPGGDVGAKDDEPIKGRPVDESQPGEKNVSKAKKAHVKLKSGYGIHVYLNDYNKQDDADEQFLQLLAPQGETNPRKHHILHMQVRPSGTPGLILLRAGGLIWQSCTDSSVETVGEGDKNNENANKFIDVVGMFVTNVDKEYVNFNKLTVIKADKVALLGAGFDDSAGAGAGNNIPPTPTPSSGGLAGAANAPSPQVTTGRVPERDKKGPHWCPAVVFDYAIGQCVISDNVFLSASHKAKCVEAPMIVGPPTAGMSMPCRNPQPSPGSQSSPGGTS